MASDQRAGVSHLTLTPIVLGSILLGIIIGGFLPRSSQREDSNGNQQLANGLGPARTDQEQARTAEQAAASETYSQEWPPGFGPESWPNWTLAILAIWAGSIALESLKTLVRQTDAAVDNAAAALATALSANRPFLVIREVSAPALITLMDTNIESMSKQDYVAAGLGKLSGEFLLVNQGSSHATPSFLRVMWFVGNHLPMRNPFLDNTDKREVPAIPAGVLKAITLPEKALTLEEWASISRNELGLYVVGKVLYEDIAGNSRRTGFCRRFSLRNRRFEATDSEPDYEYTD